MQETYRHCEQLVREADRDRYLATLFAPAECRPTLYALYAFDIEISRVRVLSRQPLPGEMRLQWWRDVLHGERAGEAKANPVAAALLETFASGALSPERLLDLLDARAFDLYDEPMRTVEQLETYGRRTSGNVLADAARVLDRAAQPTVTDLAVGAGIAVAITTLLRAFAVHASRGQLYVPLDVLEAHGADPEDPYAARTGPGLLAALGAMRARARRHLQQSRETLAGPFEKAFPAFLPLAVLPLYLDRMERRGYDPFRTAVEVPQWRRQWALWRSARTSSLP